MALIFVMMDGVGLAPPSAHNPVARGFARLAQTLGATLTDQLAVTRPALLARPIDATLGVPGLPQSGSGHSAIYGGFNAAAQNGRHQPSYPTIAMRAQLAHQNMLSAALAAGYSVAWANAYLPGYDAAVTGRRLRHTAGTWAALHAGLPLRGVAELRDGLAVSWDITQALARTRPDADDLPLIEAADAGGRLARLARSYDLVAFETYLPDLAGHERIPITLEAALDAVDGLIAGVLAKRDAADTLVITSDHGNSEDTTTRVHTRNPVPLIAIGPAADVFAPISALDELVPALLSALAQSRQL